MKELYRAVVQRRPILAMLEPDTTQEGGLTQAAITEMLTSEKLQGVKFDWLKKQHAKWAAEGALAPNAFDHAPSGAEVAASNAAAAAGRGRTGNVRCGQWVV